MNAVLISCYDLGHQPFGLAEPAAWLRRAGVRVECLDLSVEGLREKPIRRADLVAFYVPMHTATRLALRTLRRVREMNPTVHVCFYGLYAPMNAAFLRRSGVHTLLGGEFEEGLASLAKRLPRGNAFRGAGQKEPLVSLDRQEFLVPDRSGLPPLDRYAALLVDGEARTAGYVESSRGCRHLCRHCPVVPVYRGRFRVVQAGVVLEDVRRQVSAGARHITFGDPDFLNAPGHVLPLVEKLHAEFPDLTYDVTAKVEHLLRYGALLPKLRRTGCLFVTTAVESVDDRILEILDKGHTREDFLRVVRLCDETGLSLSPTFIPFSPWTTLEGYLDLLETLDRLGLIDQVAPIQLAIRLLIPPGSLLLELEEVRRIIGPLDEERLYYPWRNPDPVVDRLQEEIERMVQRGEAEGKRRREMFRKIWELSHERAGGTQEILPISFHLPARAGVPYLSEPWYC